MKNNKNIKKVIVGLILVVLVLFVPVVISDGVKYLEKTKVDRILKTDDYAYLPEQAKEYIKEVYEKTGEVILTEKNKEENRPYLNPLYVSYLGIGDKEKSEVGSIPSPLIVDYSAIGNTYGNDYDERYDLRDYNLVTPVRDQSPLGLCWTFATSSVLETHLMKKNNLTYDASSTQKFSERQLDYATAIDGIKDYDSEYVSFIERNLGDGGNFYISTIALANGISAVDLGWKTYDGSKDKLELNKVLNYNNSLYEVNSTVNMPTLNVKELTVDNKDEIRTSYINLIKENILENGAAVVSTYYSDACLHTESSLDNVVLDVEDNCVSASDGHAMTVIGWDDTIKYDYCADTGAHNDDITNCTNKVEGQGVWILKNSWGDDYQPYPYLAYDSSHSGFHFINNMTDTTTKVWDNNYVVGSQQVIMGTISDAFGANVVGEEKLELVKLMTYTANATVNVKVLKADGSYTENYTVSRELPGLITLDLSDENINVNKDSSVVISSSDGYFVDQISLFTSNTNEDYYIDLEKYEGAIIDDYEYRVYSKTKNISSNEEIQYKLYNSEGTDVTSLLVVENNIVAENNINTLLKFNNEIDAGKYELEAIYDNYSNSVNITMPLRYGLEGDGTVDSPYYIYNEEDLNQIRYDLDAYYQLKDNIELTEDWRPIGTINSPFRGGFDGSNYTISGLKIESDTNESVGLFGYVDAKYDYDTQTPNELFYREKTYIKNVIFENANVSNTGNAGILIGQLILDPNTALESWFNVKAPTMTIDNVHFIGGSVTSLEKDAGAIIGNIKVVAKSWIQPNLEINNLYSSATLSGYNSVGLIGFINDINISGSGIMLNLEMTNFQNVGILKQSIFDSVWKAEDNYSPVVGGLYGNAKFVLNNYIINSIFDSVDYTGDFSKYNSQFFLGGYDYTDSATYNLTNGYFITKFNGDKTIPYVTADEINDETLYENWENFDLYWKIETENEITRIPVLKGIDYNYTNVEDINLKLYDKVSLLDYIEGKFEFQYVSFEIISNENIVDIAYTFDDNKENQRYYDDFEIDALNKGTAKVRIVNQYDGLEKEININVTADKVEKPTITYYFSDADDAETYTQNLNALEKFNLLKNKFINVGYKFKEWNTISDGTGTSYLDEALFENGIDENLRLYAQWQRILYTIKFDANGGTGSMSDRTAYINNTIFTSNSFIREGYTFTGWNTKADGTGISCDNNGRLDVNEDLVSSIDGEIITLYAQWEANKYTVIYNSNGGTGNMENDLFTYDKEQALSPNSFTNGDLVFVGWNTKADGSGDTYLDKEKVKNLTTGESITLYAQWKLITYDVTFDANGGTFKDDKTTIVVEDWDDSKLSSLEKPTREGYTFKGFFTEKEGGTSLESYIAEAGIDQDNLIFYAQWEEEVPYIIEDYVEDKINNYIDKIGAQTNIESYKDKFKLGSNYRLEIDLGNKQHIFTGSKTKLYKNDNLILEFTNIIRGDIYADGKISALDYVSVREHIMDEEKITDPIFVIAADIEEDGKITALDYIAIRTIIMEGAN